MNWINTYLYNLWQLSMEMAPYLLLGFLIAGILSVYVPKSWIQKHLGGKKMSAVVKAALFGIPLPLCSCGVIPTSISLKEHGASKGSTVSFLISTPQTGIDSVLATYALIGLPFAIIKVVIALITGVVGGQLVHLLDPEEADLQNNTLHKELSRKKGKLRSMLDFAFGSFVEDIAKWLVIGLFIATAITTLVPDDFFQSYLAYSWLAIPVILLVSTPMYICATGSVPIAAALMIKGMSPGAALVFLLAGPATNAATITVLWNKLGRKATIIYLAVIIVSSILFGFVIDLFYTDLLHIDLGKKITPNHHEINWVAWISGMILWILLIKALGSGYIGVAEKKKQTIDIGPFTGLQWMNTSRIAVTGMTCNHCRNLIEEEVSQIQGITSVQTNLKNGTVEIQGQNFSLNQVKSKIESLGYTCS